jgi:hypothetical protein
LTGGGECGGSGASLRLRARALVGTAIPSASTSEIMRMRGLLCIIQKAAGARMAQIFVYEIFTRATPLLDIGKRGWTAWRT